MKSLPSDRQFPEFHQEIKAFRKSFDDASKSSLFDSTVRQAFQKAEETLEQVCQSSVHSCARDHVMLLEVYAGTNSPLAEVVTLGVVGRISINSKVLLCLIRSLVTKLPRFSTFSCVPNCVNIKQLVKDIFTWSNL